MRSARQGSVGADRRPGERGQPRRTGVLVVRRPVLRRQPRAAQARHPRQPRTGVAGLARLCRVRPAGGPLAPPVGARVRRLRRRREAQLASGARPADVRARRLGRTRWIRRPRTRQLGATVPHHLGDRARAGRHLRPTAAGRRPQGPLRAPSSRRRADRRGRCGDRGARRGARTHVGGARCGVVTHRHGRIRVPRPGRDRGERWHRRQPRPGAQELAGPDGPGARTAAQRRARTRGRPDDRHQRGRGCPRDQLRPDVALHRGHHQLRPDLADARHPDPARAVVAVARCHRKALARTALPGFRHPGHTGVHRQDRATTTPGSC